MSQLIEGVDNEVTLAFILFTGAAAIAVPWYLFRPNTRNFHHGAQENVRRTLPSSESETVQTSGVSRPSSDRTDAETQEAVVRRASQQNENAFAYSRPVPNTDISNTESRPGLQQGVFGADEQQQAVDGIISVKVKHNTTDSIFSVPKTMTLINFKRHCYQTELEQGKNVRLIYNGRILAGDHYTLQFLGITNGCVIHAQISEHHPTPGATTAMDIHDLDIGFLFVPMMSFAFILGWTFVVAFDDLFGVTSIVLLSFLSGIFILLAYIV